MLHSKSIISSYPKIGTFLLENLIGAFVEFSEEKWWLVVVLKEGTRKQDFDTEKAAECGYASLIEAIQMLLQSPRNPIEDPPTLRGNWDW